MSQASTKPATSSSRSYQRDVSGRTRTQQRPYSEFLARWKYHTGIPALDSDPKLLQCRLDETPDGGIETADTIPSHTTRAFLPSIISKCDPQFRTLSDPVDLVQLRCFSLSMLEDDRVLAPELPQQTIDPGDAPLGEDPFTVRRTGVKGGSAKEESKYGAHHMRPFWLRRTEYVRQKEPRFGQKRPAITRGKPINVTDGHALISSDANGTPIPTLQNARPSQHSVPSRSRKRPRSEQIADIHETFAKIQKIDQSFAAGELSHTIHSKLKATSSAKIMPDNSLSDARRPIFIQTDDGIYPHGEVGLFNHTIEKEKSAVKESEKSAFLAYFAPDSKGDCPELLDLRTNRDALKHPNEGPTVSYRHIRDYDFEMRLADQRRNMRTTSDAGDLFVGDYSVCLTVQKRSQSTTYGGLVTKEERPNFLDVTIVDGECREETTT